MRISVISRPGPRCAGVARRRASTDPAAAIRSQAAAVTGCAVAALSAARRPSCDRSQKRRRFGLNRRSQSHRISMLARERAAVRSHEGRPPRSSVARDATRSVTQAAEPTPRVTCRTLRAPGLPAVRAEAPEVTTRPTDRPLVEVLEDVAHVMANEC